MASVVILPHPKDGQKQASDGKPRQGASGPTQEDLAVCIRELLDCYWGEGDGDEPPEFIRRADLMARYFGK